MLLRRQRLTIDRPFFYNLTDFATEILTFTANILRASARRAKSTRDANDHARDSRRETGEVLSSINLKNL